MRGGFRPEFLHVAHDVLLVPHVRRYLAAALNVTHPDAHAGAYPSLLDAGLRTSLLDAYANLTGVANQYVT